jgi:hypothetical protein
MRRDCNERGAASLVGFESKHKVDDWCYWFGKDSTGFSMYGVWIRCFGGVGKPTFDVSYCRV